MSNNHYLSSELFYCDHISENDIDELREFESSNKYGEGLIYYIKHIALIDENNNYARTYIVRDNIDNSIVGYYSLKAGFIAENERKRFFKKRTFDSIPAVELSNFAVNGTYKKRHPEYKGLGKIIFNDFILPTVEAGKEHIGISILYIFALPYQRLIDNYESYKFRRLSGLQERSMHERIRPRYDVGCVFMYQRI